ncbi:MAG: 4-hydroxythreonine-4-phosphate dehydrogenase PdxA [Verrucomicrobiota bacterium]|nr:4-hydroxythreonine-4-phosphate dehydrogenase PdxA [Verrucomicrobiota bacterium]MDP7441603.1 4-hydroxythreonine-4-phosphate dehydrogenase PdxA [Verrucomicrobiota bacterium]HJN83171.1 4-hydroxythreonine-4-phosphate dehydrogenase PdxA [Verrucomicrobiota bacterium]|tara:strand:- start:808 stop:1779 length:972 start_codon:yes stop_codon:yes gene_type:complete
MSLPKIAVTMGDPAGVGPEICLHLLQDGEIAQLCSPVIFGDAAVLEQAADQCRLAKPGKVVGGLGEADGPCVLDIGAIGLGDFEIGTVNAATGRAGYTYVEDAINAALSGQVAAVTTAPLNKEAMRAAGIPFPGHTEIFAAKTHAPRSCMLQYSSEVRCVFATTHVGYAEVPRLLTKERILDTLELGAQAMRRIRGGEPKIGVLGLNPHAGEHGLFGSEEAAEILPAIEAARERGLDVEGPIPPDTAFLPAKRRATDLFVCMYHDQGHIPLKALCFDEAVNTTLGLPIVRTSVGHGTALDIAGLGQANPGSLFEAVKLALKFI